MSYPRNVPPIRDNAPPFEEPHVAFGSQPVPEKRQEPWIGWAITLVSMLVSIVFYAKYWNLGWSIAVGFVVCMLVHELGHVFAAMYYRIPATAPIFIPGMGALILTRKNSASAFDDAVVGIAGPLFGTIASAVCWGLFGLTRDPHFLVMGLFGFFMNLFNMVPVYPLDGGRIAGAVHPWLWLVGIAAMGYMFVTGIISPFRNPILLVIILMSLPQIIQGIGSRSVNHGYRVMTSRNQSRLMGAAYVALSIALVAGVIISGHQFHDLTGQDLL